MASKPIVVGELVTTAWLNSLGIAVFDVTVAGATSATLDTGAILPTTYSVMEIDVYARGDAAVLGNALWLRFNGDTAADYDYQHKQASGATLTASEGFAQSVMDVGFVTGSSAPAGAFTQTRIEIVNYGNVIGQKDVYARCAHKQGTTTGTLIVQETAGFWRPTGAGVNRVTLLPASGNFVTGSRMIVNFRGSAT